MKTKDTYIKICKHVGKPLLEGKTAKEMFEELGYDGDISWRSALYSKFNKENNGETKIDIDLEDPQHTLITKTISNDFWGEEKNESFTFEEIKAVNKLIDELIERYKISELGWESNK